MAKIYVEGEWIGKREWKKKLASNKGLFKKVEVKAPFAGPHLKIDKTGREEVIGDMGEFEESIFVMYATPFQYKFYNDLKKQDIEAANEYMFTITGAVDKWKEDIKVLQNFLDVLRKEENLFVDEEKRIETIEEIKEKLPRIIEEHLPATFQKIRADLKDMDKFLKDLEVAVEKMQELEKFIKDYFEYLKEKRRLGFLFE